MFEQTKKINLPLGELSEYVLDAINSGVLLIDTGYRIVYLNRHVRNRLKLEASDLVGQEFFKMPGVSLVVELKEHFRLVREKGEMIKISGIKPLVSAKDNSLLIDLTIHPWSDREGNFVGWILICEDSNLQRGFFNDALRVNIFVRYVVNLMSEGATVLNQDGKLEYANQSFYRMLGYKPEDLLDKKWTEWCFENDLVVEAGVKKIKHEVLDRGLSIYRLRLKKKDGTLMPVTMTVLKNFEGDLDIGSIGVIVDETEKVKLESEYRVVDTLNKKILETISTYIVTLDFDLNIKFVNKRVEEEFEVESADVVGKKISEIFPSLRVIEDWSSWVLRSLRPYKVDRYKLSINSNSLVFINVDIQPLYYSNKLNGVVCSFDDVTLSAKLEEQIEVSYRELEITHGKLANFLKRQSDFLADVSHELRTPLTIIKGNIEVALQDKNVSQNELREVLSMVDSEVNRMSVMVRDLLMLTKMDQGEASLKTEIFDLDQVVNDLTGKMEFLKEYENRLEIIKYQNIKIKADRDKILTLIWNLVENGFKYSSGDSKVQVLFKRSEFTNELLIQVSDNGIGIAEKDIKNIFDRFFRVDKARNRDKGGSGLGLAICKRIVEAHVGRIEVISNVNNGTVFTVSLPIIIE